MPRVEERNEPEHAAWLEERGKMSQATARAAQEEAKKRLQYQRQQEETK